MATMKLERNSHIIIHVLPLHLDQYEEGNLYKRIEPYEKRSSFFIPTSNTSQAQRTKDELIDLQMFTSWSLGMN